MQKSVLASALRRAQAGLHHLPKSHWHSLLATEGSRQPIKPFVETVTCGCTCRLDEPLAITHVVQAKLFSNFGSRHGIGKILFVCEDKKHCIAHLVLVEHL